MGNGIMYGLVVIAGFVILGGAIIYAMARNKVSPEQHRRTEEATKRLYEAQPDDDVTPR